MASSVILNYPHDTRSLEPLPMRAEAIWQIGEVARCQVGLQRHRPKLDLARMIARTRQLRVNGLAFETRWDLGSDVTDDSGIPVLGATEYDESCPKTALIYLNDDASNQWPLSLPNQRQGSTGANGEPTSSWVLSWRPGACFTSTCTARSSAGHPDDSGWQG
jgi:hypothetical protein